MSGKVDRMVGEMQDQIGQDAALQLRQGIAIILDSPNTCQLSIGGDTFPAIHWIGTAPTPGATVWVLSHGERGKDYLILGVQS